MNESGSDCTTSVTSPSEPEPESGFIKATGSTSGGIPIAMVSGCSSGASYDTPEDTVNSYLNAYEKLDFMNMLACILPVASNEEMRTDVEELVEEFKDMMKDMNISFSINNRNIEVISRTEDSAIVAVSYDMELTYMDETETESSIETFTLVKSDGKWLLTEMTGEEE